MAEQIQTAWMWHDEHSMMVKGATVDLDDQIIQYYDEPGCACTDSAHIQTITHFLEKGAIQPVPDDVLEEMRDTMTRFVSQFHTN